MERSTLKLKTPGETLGEIKDTYSSREQKVLVKASAVFKKLHHTPLHDQSIYHPHNIFLNFIDN